MSLDATATIDAPVDTVIRAFTNRDFQQYAGAAAGGSLDDFRIDGDPAGAFTIAIVRAVAEERIPDLARSFIRGRLLLSQEEHWAAPAPDGSRTSEVSISFGSVPLKVTGTERLAAAGDGSTLTVTGNVTSGISFLGARIAQMAEPVIAKAVRLQATAVARWIREH
ncbi:hypothetical protein BKD30_10915 [Tersicoccus phoenicis]|uniref:Proteinase inhibitor I25 cystatin n=1 Tax=Tersicoccus phoenicis TaxID=554083 RepID=A0A1R1L8K8_9MICC|nr:DUF2505 domain-containing protein [Tersicoccus phoenicis]OMH23868.1 hypothetical protein BKD30_10915 [Tersicoccus phoenicis]